MRLIRIGRGELNDVRFEESSVSRRHAELIITVNDEFFLVDCVSTAGTLVNQNGEWHSIRQGFVSRNAQLRLGAQEVSVSEILSLAG